MKIVIIGAAPLGLGAAYRLNELMNSGKAASDIELVILEKESCPGGLSRSVTDEKGFLWDMGGHITFNHNFPYYEKAVNESVKKWNQLVRNCQVDIGYMFHEDGLHLVPYPAQFAIPFFPNDVKKACLEDLRKRYQSVSNTVNLLQQILETPKNFQQWIFNNFGPTILDAFFRPYSEKVWTVELEEMNSVWVGTRVALLPQEKLEQLCSLTEDELKKADFGWGPNKFFAFPTYGGTGSVWKAISDNLPKKWIEYNSNVTDIDAEQRLITYEHIEDGKMERRQITYDILINSSPIDQVIKFTKLCPELNLVHNKVFIIGLGMELPMPEFVKQFTWLYFPDSIVPFYRVTFLSKYGEVTPNNNKYWSILCECARKIDDPITESEIRELTIKSLAMKSIIRPEKIVSVFSTVLSYGYPVPNVQRDSELTRAHMVLERNNIYSRGRFGGWKYEVSNQDHCFIQGKEIIDRIILNEPEKLYRTGLPLCRG
uniref:Amino_oxidase domain-containing protein n=1 Tax=Syphacia muris TaxID=451379 RepID=A0A0N5AJ30_9BILA